MLVSVNGQLANRSRKGTAWQMNHVTHGDESRGGSACARTVAGAVYAASVLFAYVSYINALLTRWSI